MHWDMKDCCDIYLNIGCENSFQNFVMLRGLLTDILRNMNKDRSAISIAVNLPKPALCHSLLTHVTNFQHLMIIILTLPLFVSLITISLSLFFSLPHSLCLSLFLSCSSSLYLCFSLCCSLSLSVSVICLLSLSLSLSISVPVCLSVSLILRIRRFDNNHFDGLKSISKSKSLWLWCKWTNEGKSKWMQLRSS